MDDDERARWEWSAEAIREAGYRMVDMIAEHLSGLPERPVFRPYPPELAAAMASEALPERGAPWAEVEAEIAARIEPFPFGNGHPRFYGWVNPPPAVVGVLAEALASAMNPSVAGGNHAAVHLEGMVVRWLAELLGYPADHGGLLVSGGSVATLHGLAVARHRALGEEGRARGLHGAPPLVVYTSDQGHSCVRKAVTLLGLGADGLRVLASDGRDRLDPGALAAAIADDRRAGRRPMAVVASAGTVNCGAIDPLDALADLCAAEGVWLHVDAAYGGPAILSARYRAAIAPIARADSVAMDPHKWLYAPVEAGLVLVRDAAALRATFSHVPAYLRTDGDPGGVGGPVWRSELGFQQTRGFRALKVWACLRYHGVAGYRSAIENDIALAERLAAGVRAAPELEVVGTPSLSVVCLRARARPGEADDAGDRRSRGILRALQLAGEAFLAGTEVDGRFALRACVVNPRARPEDIDRTVAALRRLAADVGAA